MLGPSPSLDMLVVFVLVCWVVALLSGVSPTAPTQTPNPPSGVDKPLGGRRKGEPRREELEACYFYYRQVFSRLRRGQHNIPDDTWLRLYGLLMQATMDDVQPPPPTDTRIGRDMIALPCDPSSAEIDRDCWDAWAAMRGLDPDAAVDSFVEAMVTCAHFVPFSSVQGKETVPPPPKLMDSSLLPSKPSSDTCVCCDRYGGKQEAEKKTESSDSPLERWKNEHRNVEVVYFPLRDDANSAQVYMGHRRRRKRARSPFRSSSRDEKNEPTLACRLPSLLLHLRGLSRENLSTTLTMASAPSSTWTEYITSDNSHRAPPRVAFGQKAKVHLISSLKPYNYDGRIWDDPREYLAQTRLNMVEARLERFRRALRKTPDAVVYSPTPEPKVSAGDS